MMVLKANSAREADSARGSRQPAWPARAVARWRGALSGPRAGALVALVTAGALLSAACAPGQLADENALPSGTPDPAAVQTPKGTLAFYRKILATVPSWLDPLIFETGLLTDELVALPLPIFNGGEYTALDSRAALEAHGLKHYQALHRLRAQAREARGFATSYLSDTATSYSKPAVQGHLYALEGYAELFLADLFCSGIPLSTVDYQADYTLAPGSTTPQVYAHAAALLDTALTLLDPTDSVRLRHLAAVGRGRALLGIGDAASVAAAAAVVAGVPDDYRYVVEFVTPNSDNPNSRELLQKFIAYNGPGAVGRGTPGVADREGFNGLAYRASADPRTPATLVGQDTVGNELYFPAKYPLQGPVPFALADGVEARLIEAEAALRLSPEDGRWLVILNQLRQTALPGTALPELADPGTGLGPTGPNARVDLLFGERAFWLYLTGHRQGDLRRLVRHYEGRTPERVYPTGGYAGGSGAYGSELVFPVPASEALLNPKYTGCFHRGA